MKTLPLTWFLFILLVSCQSKQPESLSGVIKINPDEFINPPKDATEWIENLQFIPLETPEGQYVPDDVNTKIRKNFILLGNDKKLMIFDLSGKFLKQIDAKGAGPQEYRVIADYDLLPDKDEVVICEEKKMAFYHIDGTFIEKVPIPFRCMNIAPLGKDYFGFAPVRVPNGRTDSSGNFQLFIIDRKGIIKERKFGYQYPVYNTSQPSFVRTPGDQSSMISLPFDDDIYILGPGPLIKIKYQFDFGDYNADTTYLNNPDIQNDFEFLQRNQIRVFPLEGFAETNNTLMIRCNSDKHQKMAFRLINLKSGNHRTVVMEDRPKIGIFYGWPIYGYRTAFGDYFVVLQSAMDVMENYKSLTLDEKKILSEFPGFKSLNTLTEDDNPVLTLYKVKDF